MVGLPMVSMSLSLFSMFGGNFIANLFNHLSPLYYIEKVINFFPFAKNIDLSSLPIPSNLSRWIFLKRIQLFSLLFSMGIFVALLLTIISKDIAFGWSTTLQISPNAFHAIVSYISLPWHTFFPSAVPSLELIELSHYFRLGGEVNIEMVQHADKLGAWWKFLAMATLFYAIFLRLIFCFMAQVGFKKALKRAFLNLEGAKTLLKEFLTPYVSTQAEQQEQHLEVVLTHKSPIEKEFESRYSAIVGWNYGEDDLLLVKDSNGIEAKHLYVVGGRNSFSQDQAVLSHLKNRVLLYVKAWEPPTMDFMDLLEDVIAQKEVSAVDVTPLGTASNGYVSRRKDVEVWLRKLDSIESEKLGVVDV